MAFAAGQNFDPINPSTSNMLSFLQTGLDLGLGLSSLKVQVAAISAATSKRWAEDPLLVTFLKGVLKIRPPSKHPFPQWDLSLVLEVLSSDPFSPVEQASLWNLTLQTAFLIAITSGRRVSELHALGVGEENITFFPDRVELRPLRGFIPKVATSIHLLEPWALPVFLDPESSTHHNLDISRVLRAYLEATKPFRVSERLFIVPFGKNRGKEATSRTLSSWIIKLIQKAYKTKGLAPPSRAKAHSTRAVSASWAARANVSLETVCRAASWSSRHTFFRHYRIDPGSLTTVEFGRRTIQSAMSFSN